MVPSHTLRSDHLLWLLLILLLWAVSACDDAPEEPTPTFLAPTVNSAFVQPSRIPTKTPEPTLTRPAPPTLSSERNEETIVIFDERFHRDWGFIDAGTFTEIAEGDAVAGTKRLQMIPRQPGHQLLIYSLESNRQPYHKEKIVRLSLYLKSPQSDLDPGEFTIKLQGSNRYPYWVENDTSTNQTEDLFFSKTNLTFYDINQIPQDEWVLVELVPEEQVFDPVYDYFTGFYLESFDRTLQTIEIDKIEMVIESD